MNKILIAGCTLLTAFAAVAMPNKKELAKAQRLVEDVTAADIKALKAGEKTAKEVAETHMQLAEKAENQAEKYLLYQGAFRIYARNEEYDRAADALQAISRDVDDVPPELIIEIVSKEMRRVAGKKAPRILTIFKQAKRTAKYRKEIVTVEAGLKAKPHDTELNRKYGECLAELGRWKEAIPAFAKSAGEVAKIAAGEKDGKLSPQQCADFWWDYGGETDDFTPYKAHAAQLYKKAMADTAFEGLARTRAEQRVKEVEMCVLLQDGNTSKGDTLVPPSFALGKGVEIEMVKCPANGRVVELGVVGAGALEGPFRLSITRPFWVSKSNVNFAQMNAAGLQDRWLSLPKCRLKDKKDVWDKWGADTSLDDIYEFCRFLNLKYKSEVPAGYVFRLPTLAEYLYMRQSGERDMKDPYSNKMILPDAERGKWFHPVFTMLVNYIKEHDGLPGGMPIDFKHKTKWGILDAYTFHTPLLDMIAPDGGEAVIPITGDKNAAIRSVLYLQGKDPFAYYALPNAKRLNVSGSNFGDTFLQVQDSYRSFRIVLGPDLVAEKTNGRFNSAQKGAEKIFWIAKDKDIKLSMIHCPAGTFRKGFEKFSVGDVSKVPSALIPHDVKISRPFWMAKYPMTFAQVKELAPSLVGGKDWPALIKAHGQYMVFSGADGLDAAAVCRELNKRFAAEIPRGYVFRLPTEAEWEYCLKEGGKCADSRLNREGVYSDRTATSWTEDRKAAHPEIDANRGCGVGTLKPNGWGFYDLIGTISQLFLDNGPFQCGVASDGVAVDPFQNDGSSKNHALYPKPGGNASVLIETGGHSWTGFRVVLGPDLEKGWNEKHKTRK